MQLLRANAQDCTGQTFDGAMGVLIGAPADRLVELVFRTAALPSTNNAAPSSQPFEGPCTLTVVGPKGEELKDVRTIGGANLRKTLLEAKIEVYDGMAKLTNCNGNGQCGTCVVKVHTYACHMSLVD